MDRVHRARRRPGGALPRRRCCRRSLPPASGSVRWDELDRRRPEALGRGLRAADLPGADAPRRRSRPPVPVHLEPVAQPRRDRAGARRRSSGASPGSRCRRSCLDSSPWATTAWSPSKRSSRRSSPTCSRGWCSMSTWSSGSPATPTSRSKTRRPTTCSKRSRWSCAAAASARRCASRSRPAYPTNVLGVLLDELDLTHDDVTYHRCVRRSHRPVRRCTALDRPDLKDDAWPAVTPRADPPRARGGAQPVLGHPGRRRARAPPVRVVRRHRSRRSSAERPTTRGCSRSR